MPIKVISPYGHQLKTDVNELDAEVRSTKGVDSKDEDAPEIYILNSNEETKKARMNLTKTESKNNYTSFYSPNHKTIVISNEEYQKVGDKLIRHELAHHYDIMKNKDIPAEEREKRTREAEFGQSGIYKWMKNLLTTDTDKNLLTR